MSNLFLITLDAVRRDHLGCYGYSRKITPNLDKLAKEYQKIDWCFTPASYTSASVPSILSAKYPTHISTRFGITLPYASSLNDLAPITQLKKMGYKTAAFTANPITSSSMNRTLNLFFDYFSDTYSETKQSTPYKTSSEVLSEVVAYLKQNPDNNFIWIHLMDAHGPYVPYTISKFVGDRLWKKQQSLPHLTRIISDTFDHETIESILTKPGTQFYQLRDVLKDDQGGIIDFQKDPRYYIAQYDLGIQLMDHTLGRLFQYLQLHNLWEDATIAIHSDHGETMGENGLYFNHAYLTTPELALSPLIFKFGRQQKASGNVASAIDILPTLLASKSIPLPRGLDGISLFASSSRVNIYTIGPKDISIINQTKRTITSFHQGDLDYKAHKQPQAQLLPIKVAQPLNPLNFANLYCFKYKYHKHTVQFISHSYDEQDISLLEQCRLDLLKNSDKGNTRLNLSPARIDNLIETLVSEDSRSVIEVQDQLAEYTTWVKILQAENKALKRKIFPGLKLPKWFSQFRSNKI
ncbi:MAG: sulfatase [bacterium]